MSKQVKVSQIEQQIDKLHDAVSRVARWYRDNPDYSDEGRKSKHAAAIKNRTYDYPGKLEKLAQLVDSLEPAAQAQATTARANVLPVAQDSTDALAAELAAQRILQRPGLKDTSDVLSYITDADPSPGLSIAITEWQQRGMLDDDTLNAVLAKKSPEYAQAQQHAGRTQQTAGFLRQRLAKVNEQAGTTKPVEMDYVPSVQSALSHGWQDETTVDNVPYGAFDQVHLDRPYRSQ